MEKEGPSASPWQGHQSGGASSQGASIRGRVRGGPPTRLLRIRARVSDVGGLGGLLTPRPGRRVHEATSFNTGHDGHPAGGFNGTSPPVWGRAHCRDPFVHTHLETAGGGGRGDAQNLFINIRPVLSFIMIRHVNPLLATSPAIYLPSLGSNCNLREK